MHVNEKDSVWQFYLHYQPSLWATCCHLFTHEAGNTVTKLTKSSKGLYACVRTCLASFSVFVQLDQPHSTGVRDFTTLYPAHPMSNKQVWVIMKMLTNLYGLEIYAPKRDTCARFRRDSIRSKVENLEMTISGYTKFIGHTQMYMIKIHPHEIAFYDQPISIQHTVICIRFRSLLIVISAIRQGIKRKINIYIYIS